MTLEQFGYALVGAMLVFVAWAMYATACDFAREWFAPDEIDGSVLEPIIEGLRNDDEAPMSD